MIERKTFIDFGNNQDHSIDYLLGIFEDVRATTLQRVEGISTEELHWQYAEGWNTIGVLLSHIIAIGHCFRITCIEERDLTEEEGKQWNPSMEMGQYIPQLITDQPIDFYWSELEISQVKLFNAIKKIDKEKFLKKDEGFNMAWTLYHAAEDEVHHRGQISILRKLYKARTLSS